MPKRNQPAKEPVIVDEEILRSAKLALESDKQRVVPRCVICGAESAPTSIEHLCWVCRRLKISAWRESDQPLPLQE
jgi:hypothetical protein